MFIESVADYLLYKEKATAVEVQGKRRKILVPCANTLLVARGLVVANTYNPNHVSDDKLELLRQSIIDNGFAFPIVVIWDGELQRFIVVDGFHRYLISSEKWLGLSHVPVAVLTHDASQRMIATWQFNKARGSHEVDLDADLIRALIQQGMEEDEITKHLGIDLDTVHRYKQLTGMAQLFQNAQYSMSWGVQETA
jgi:ParB-like chromosome segregation protein Spo0J